MFSLKKNHSSIRQQIALFGLSLFCLCADVSGMAAGGNQQNDNRLTGTRIPGRATNVLRDLCSKVYGGRNQQNENFLAETCVPGRIASVLVDLCSAVYEGEEGLCKVGGIEKNFSLFFNQAGDFSGAVSRLRGTNSLVVTFPGSRTKSKILMLRDWFINFSVCRPLGDDGFSARLGEKDCLVHPGYARDVNGYRNDMMAKIKNARSFDDIYFTGHSKGGGEALLGALMYARENPDLIGRHKIKVVTFCAPPVFWGDRGTQSFYGHLDKSDVARFYTNMDPVPSVPQAMRLAHVGTEFLVKIRDEEVENVLSALCKEIVTAVATAKAMGPKAAVVMEVATAVVDSITRVHSLKNFSPNQINQHVRVQPVVER